MIVHEATCQLEQTRNYEFLLGWLASFAAEIPTQNEIQAGVPVD